MKVHFIFPYLLTTKGPIDPGLKGRGSATAFLNPN